MTNRFWTYREFWDWPINLNRFILSQKKFYLEVLVDDDLAQDYLVIFCCCKYWLYSKLKTHKIIIILFNAITIIYFYMYLKKPSICNRYCRRQFLMHVYILVQFRNMLMKKVYYGNLISKRHFNCDHILEGRILKSDNSFVFLIYLHTFYDIFVINMLVLKLKVADIAKHLNHFVECTWNYFWKVSKCFLMFRKFYWLHRRPINLNFIIFMKILCIGHCDDSLSIPQYSVFIYILSPKEITWKKNLMYIPDKSNLCYLKVQKLFEVTVINRNLFFLLNHF